MDKKHINTYEQFNSNINQNILPNIEMINWYQDITKFMDSWDEIDRDIQLDNIRQDFFDKFEDQLKDVDKFGVIYKLF